MDQYGELQYKNKGIKNLVSPCCMLYGVTQKLHSIQEVSAAHWALLHSAKTSQQMYVLHSVV